MKNKNKLNCMFYRMFVYGYILFSICSSSTIIRAEDPSLLPRSSHLRGREIPADLVPFQYQPLGSAEQKEILSILGGIGVGPENKLDSSLQDSKSKFRQMVSGISITGDLSIIKSYVPRILVPLECLTTVEENLKLNLLVTQVPKALPLMSAVSYIFTLNQDGHITDLEKERSTGNSVLDNTVPNTLSRISPLPMPKSVPFSRQPFLRLRFTLTYYPSV